MANDSMNQTAEWHECWQKCWDLTNATNQTASTPNWAQRHPGDIGAIVVGVVLVTLGLCICVVTHHPTFVRNICSAVWDSAHRKPVVLSLRLILITIALILDFVVSVRNHATKGYLFKLMTICIILNLLWSILVLLGNLERIWKWLEKCLTYEICLSIDIVLTILSSIVFSKGIDGTENLGWAPVALNCFVLAIDVFSLGWTIFTVETKIITRCEDRRRSN